MKKIFVYGSLRTDMYNYEKYLKGHIEQSELAYVKGFLHEIKGVLYPALLEGDALIAGEIMQIDDDEIFEKLDALEVYHGKGHIENEYDKMIKDIYDDDGEFMERLPVYMFNVRNENNKKRLSARILENDYVAFMAKKGNCKLRIL